MSKLCEICKTNKPHYEGVCRVCLIEELKVLKEQNKQLDVVYDLLSKLNQEIFLPKYQISIGELLSPFSDVISMGRIEDLEDELRVENV